MISVEQAREQITRLYRRMETKSIPLSESLGKVLATDLYAPFPLPHYRQSSVDGYAIALGNYTANQFELVQDESSAGSSASAILKAGQALRIFTGASVPLGADAVVMQEKITQQGNNIIIQGSLPEPGLNIRYPGSDLQANDLALSAGTRINPPKIGLLASLGITEIPVFASPVVNILITGNEFAEPGQTLREGIIYESNSYILDAALRQTGVDNIKIKRIKDDPAYILQAIEEALRISDIVLITGGVSVGDYDYTVQAAEKAGVKQIFHKIAQRPGKPMYFGMKEDIYVFGLPGNMSSVLTCFYMYIYPLIAYLQNIPNSVKKIKAILSEEVKSPEGLTSFWKGFYKEGNVKALPGQESYKLKSYADANCLIEIPQHITRSEKGSKVFIHLLPD